MTPSVAVKALPRDLILTKNNLGGRPPTFVACAALQLRMNAPSSSLSYAASDLQLSEFFISRQLAPQRGLKFLVAFRVEVRPTRLIRRSMGPNPARSRLMHCGNGTTVDYLPLWQVAMARTLDLP